MPSKNKITKVGRPKKGKKYKYTYFLLLLLLFTLTYFSIRNTTYQALVEENAALRDLLADREATITLLTTPAESEGKASNKL